MLAVAEREGAAWIREHLARGAATSDGLYIVTVSREVVSRAQVRRSVPSLCPSLCPLCCGNDALQHFFVRAWGFGSSAGCEDAANGSEFSEASAHCLALGV